MTDKVWGSVAEGEADVDPSRREQFTIRVLPPEPDERVSTVEEENAKMEAAAREQAWQFWMQSCTGTSVTPPDLRSWPERYRKAFSGELARLKREHR